MKQIITSSDNSALVQASADGKTVIAEYAEVTGNLDRVQRMRQAEINSGTFGHVHASIPLVALAGWANSLGVTLQEVIADDRLLDRFLTDQGAWKVHKGWV